MINCTNNGTNTTTIDPVEPDDFGGLIVGPFCYDFTVSNSRNYATMESEYLGGIVGGYCSNFKVKNCSNNPAGETSLQYGSGGITGYGCNNFTVDNCKNNMYLSDSGVGGIVAMGSYNFTVTNCINNARVSGWGSGGIVGNRCSAFTVNDCTNNGDIDGAGCGGICGANIGMNGYYNINNMFATKSYHIGRNLIEINRCTNNGQIQSNDIGGICGKYCGRIGTNLQDMDYDKPAASVKITINNCVNNGTYSNDFSTCGGILGPYAGSYNMDNDGNSIYGVQRTDIIINSCTTCDCGYEGLGPLCGENLLNNNVTTDSTQNKQHSQSTVIINKSYTGNSTSRIIGGYGNNVSSPYNIINYIDNKNVVHDLIDDDSYNNYI